MNRLDYNLNKIAEIDKMIELNANNREEYVNSNNYLFIAKKIIKLLSNKILLSILLVILTMILYNKNKILLTIIYDCLFIFSYNSILIIMDYAFDIPEDYYDNLNTYMKNRESLLIRRNLYINLYNYTKDKEKSILNNIKLRINNKYFLDYNKYKNLKWLKDDVYAYATLKEMQYEEMVYTYIIRNRIELELISPYYNEEIPKENLKEILEVL